MSRKTQIRDTVVGVAAVFSTPFFLGLAPIFGKLALLGGADAFGVAALRTIVAVALLWLIYYLFFPKLIYIYPAGLLGCVVIGVINGIGSLFYYGGLHYLDASMVQLINGMYLPLAIVLSLLTGQRLTRRHLLRVLIALAALVVITTSALQPPHWLGVGLMLGSALMFAGTFILSQYVLYEMPAPTGALYILTTMGVVVTMVWLAVGAEIDLHTIENVIGPITALGITTALSRLAMFAGVKQRGSVETAMTAITEIGVSLFLAAMILGDSLALAQWAGVSLLFISILLTRQRDLLPHGYNPSALLVNTMASWQFQRIAFHMAFGTEEQDNEHGVMKSVSAADLREIMQMMGVKEGMVDPFPISYKKGYSVDLKSFLPHVVKPKTQPKPPVDDAADHLDQNKPPKQRKAR